MIIGINFYLVGSHIPGDAPWWAWLILAVAAGCYLALCHQCIKTDVTRFVEWLRPPRASTSNPSSSTELKLAE
jgi:hypothetical protein